MWGILGFLFWSAAPRPESMLYQDVGLSKGERVSAEAKKPIAAEALVTFSEGAELLHHFVGQLGNIASANAAGGASASSAGSIEPVEMPPAIVGTYEFGFLRCRAGGCWTLEWSSSLSSGRLGIERPALPDPVTLPELGGPLAVFYDSIDLKRRCLSVIGLRQLGDFLGRLPRPGVAGVVAGASQVPAYVPPLRICVVHSEILSKPEDALRFACFVRNQERVRMWPWDASDADGDVDMDACTGGSVKEVDAVIIYGPLPANNNSFDLADALLVLLREVFPCGHLKARAASTRRRQLQWVTSGDVLFSGLFDPGGKALAGLFPRSGVVPSFPERCCSEENDWMPGSSPRVAGSVTVASVPRASTQSASDSLDLLFVHSGGEDGFEAPHPLVSEAGTNSDGKPAVGSHRQPFTLSNRVVTPGHCYAGAGGTDLLTVVAGKSWKSALGDTHREEGLLEKLAPRASCNGELLEMLPYIADAAFWVVDSRAHGSPLRIRHVSLRSEEAPD